jgi:RHS repeat-associated protein
MTKVDGLGRVMEETHPENGLTTYSYTDSGRLLQKTDARGIVTTTTYDELYRPLLVDFSDSTPDLSYTYDSGAFGIGRLSTVSNGVASSAYTCSAMGQVLREDKTINGLPFFMTWQYNLAGQVTATRLPNGSTITNGFDEVGRLAAVTSDWVDADHPGTLASGFLYHASGAVTRMDLGNGTRMTRGFNDGLQLKTLEHGPIGAPGALLNFEYDYQEGVSNNGRIMGITNWNDRTRDLVFTYDSFYRLDSAQTTGSHWGLAWEYDRYGNRLNQTVTKGTGPANTLSVSTATNRVSGWSYDAAGNVLNDGRHVYTWNALNQQTTMDNGAAVYHYDAAGNRVMKVTPTKTTYYVFGVGEYSGGVWEKLYVSINGQKGVEYSNGTTYFFHSDHLGTPRVQTSLTGQVVETWDNYPYGEQWTMTGGVGNNHHYTGKERDPESGNDYFGARYYWNGNARWLSVDPEKVPTDPQQLNLYVYVRNDPVNYVDRDGRNLGKVNEGDVVIDVIDINAAGWWSADYGDGATDFGYDDGSVSQTGEGSGIAQPWGALEDPIYDHLRGELNAFSKRRFPASCKRWFSGTFGVQISEAQKYAKSAHLKEGSKVAAPYMGTTVAKYMAAVHADFLAPFGWSNIYYQERYIFLDISYEATFAHEILHKLREHLTDAELLRRLGVAPEDIKQTPTSKITKEIHDHCFK